MLLFIVNNVHALKQLALGINVIVFITEKTIHKT